MFGNSKEYQEIKKLYEEKVSKPEQLDEKPKNILDLSGALNRIKKTGAKNTLELSMPSTIKKDTTPPPEEKKVTTTTQPSPRLKADITTNQRQSRALAADDKNVKLNKFSRTQRYAADAKGVKLVPGAKEGQTVNRSTVQTKAAFDFGGIKKGERLGVMTRNQRRKYDLMAAQRAKKDTTPPPETKTTTPPPETKTTTPPPEEKKVTTKIIPKPNTGTDTETKTNKIIPKPNTGTDTKKKSGNILDKSGLPNRRSFIPLNRKDAKNSNASEKEEKLKKAKQTIEKSVKEESTLIQQVKVKQPGVTLDGGKTYFDPRDGKPIKMPKKKKPSSPTSGGKTSIVGGGGRAPGRVKPAMSEGLDDAKELAMKGVKKSVKAVANKAGSIGKMVKNTAVKVAKEVKKGYDAQEEYTPYDIVLEYLLSSEQAATIEEANYIMTEMDAKTIQDIVAQQLNEQN